MQNKIRYLSLDAWRGMAILGVVTYHLFGYIYTVDRAPFGPHGFRDFTSFEKGFWVSYPLAFGYLGVVLFFVISGFSIHLSYLRMNNNSSQWNTSLGLSYFLKRFFRIYPPYLLAVLVFIFIRHLPLHYTWPHFFLLQNLSEAHFSGINSSFWSIAHEWQYYLIYPAVLWIQRFFTLKQVWYFSILLFFVGTTYAYVLDPDCSEVFIWAFPSTLWYQWVGGMVLAEKFTKGETKMPSIWRTTFYLVAGLGCTFYVRLQGWSPLFFTLFFLDILLITLYLEMENKWKRLKFLELLGLYSFGIYLFHQPFIFAYYIRLKQWVLWSNSLLLGIGGWVYILLCFVFGMAFYHGVEKPSIAWGKKLEKGWFNQKK